MDREIKVRVFGERVGEMVDINMHVFGECLAYGRVESWIRNDREAKGDMTILERFNDMVVMEYTGLEDKDSVPIYEGDIVKTSEGRKVLVEWSNNKRYAGFYPFMPIFSTYLDHTTVLGNKFEDEDLLSEV